MHKTKIESERHACEVSIQLPQGLETLKLPDPDLCQYWRDLEHRIIYVDYDIDDSITTVVKLIHTINMEDIGKPTEGRKPIRLFLNSPGGSVSAGFTLIDAIINSQTPVYTINMGRAYSMGFLILLASDKRFGSTNSSYLLHDGSSFAYDSAAKLRDYMDFNTQTEQRIKEHVVSRTNITPEKYDERYRYEWYMYPQEALELGVIHHIIGEDGITLESLLS